MDCPSEENLIRLKLSENTKVKHLDFDITNRTLHVFHTDSNNLITSSLETLNLGAILEKSEKSDSESFTTKNDERKLLWYVLIINFGFFIVEMTFGIISKSMGLVADSLDMLSDSFVYILSLIAVNKTLVFKNRIAKVSGVIQIVLAIVGISEVIRRFFDVAEIPNYQQMIVISILALIGNALSLLILQKSKSQEAHMKASMIFTSNDIIINIGVIVAGVLVLLFGNSYPDLIVGTIVFVIVLRGAKQILALSK